MKKYLFGLLICILMSGCPVVMPEVRAETAADTTTQEKNIWYVEAQRVGEEEIVAGTAVTNAMIKMTVYYDNGESENVTDFTLEDQISEIGWNYVKVLYKGYMDSVEFFGKPSVVSGIKASDVKKDGLTLTWTEQVGASGYRIYRYNNSKKAYVLANTVYSNKYTASDLSAVTKYRYKVAAFTYKNSYDNCVEGEQSAEFAVYTAPKTTTLKAKKKGTKHVQLTWKKVNGATGYIIYHSTKENSGYKKIKTIASGKKTSFTKKGLKGSYHYFKIRAYSVKEGKTISGARSEAAYVNLTAKASLTNKLRKLKKKYPDGKYWNHVGVTIKDGMDESEIVTNEPCNHVGASISSTCNMYFGADRVYGYQCYGFASKLSDLLFGKKAPVSTHSSFKKAKVGDHVRTATHSVIIVEKHKNYIIAAEANYGGGCRIKWGRKIYKSELTGAYYITRY